MRGFRIARGLVAFCGAALLLGLPALRAADPDMLPERLPDLGAESPSDTPLQPEAVAGQKLSGDLRSRIPSLLGQEVTPIDLNSAFRLAGVENPQINIAVQRVAEAVAARQFAAAQILPSLNAGSNYNNHNGVLQQVNGSILSVDRSSLYAGAGAFTVGAGTLQIPGVVWNLNVSQSIFSFLQSRQLVAQQQFATAATRNDILLQVATAYLELLRAEELRAIAVGIRDDAAEVARVTANYAKTGQGRKADADRAATELRQRQTELVQFEANVLTVAARLAALLNLDPAVRLHPADNWVVPKAIVPTDATLPELIARAIVGRPELAERQAAVRRALLDLSAAKMLPFSPNIILGMSAGTFGGGSNLVTPAFGDFASRSDFDAVAYWTLQNLAVGNRALINGASARLNTSNLQKLAILNQVRSEVASAYARTQANFIQIGINEEAVLSAQDAFREDLLRVRNLQGLPIEVLNSLRLLSRARSDYLSSIIDFNRAQFELYVALGQPPAVSLARPVYAAPTLSPAEAGTQPAH